MNDLIYQAALIKENFNKSLDLKILELSNDNSLSNNEFLTKRDELLRMQVKLTENEVFLLEGK